MAVLQDTDRQRVWRAVMRWLSHNGDVLAVCSKTDLKAAVDATDAWIDSNSASYNAALPATFRTNASAAQKTALFCAVAAMRQGVTALRQLLGEDTE